VAAYERLLLLDGFFIKTAFPCSPATSSYGSDVVGSPRSNKRLRRAAREQRIDPKRDTTIRACPAALQYCFPSAGLGSFQGCDRQLRQFDIGQVDYPLTGKTVTRLANKRFGQEYLCTLLFGSSSARNYPSWGPVRTLAVEPVE
jgi:hypothetical protein